MDINRSWGLSLRDQEINTYETTGVYMPLARSDIEYYNPSKVILGHIHKRREWVSFISRLAMWMDINELKEVFILDLNDLT